MHVTLSFVAGTKYPTCTAQRRKCLLWCIVLAVSVHGQQADTRQKDMEREVAHLMTARSIEEHKGSVREEGARTHALLISPETLESMLYSSPRSPKSIKLKDQMPHS